MFWCLVHLSIGALCRGLYANPLEMAVQSAVACSEAIHCLITVVRLSVRWRKTHPVGTEEEYIFIVLSL